MPFPKAPEGERYGDKLQDQLTMQSQTQEAANETTEDERHYTGLPVKGYKKTVPEWKVELVNQFKVLEELVLRQIDKMRGSEQFDQRWLSIGQTELEKGFMAVNRSVFRPSRVVLEDDAGTQAQADAGGPP